MNKKEKGNFDFCNYYGLCMVNKCESDGSCRLCEEADAMFQEKEISKELFDKHLFENKFRKEN